MNKKFEKWADLYLRSVEKEFQLNDLRDALVMVGAKVPRSGVLGQYVASMGWERYDNSRRRTLWRRVEGTKPEFVGRSDKILRGKEG